MSVVLPLLGRIAEGNSIAEVWSLATAFYRDLGFSRANYGFTRFLRREGIGNPADAIFLTTGEADYARRYFDHGFFARTPVYRWAIANAGACTWGWVKEAYDAGLLTPEEREAVEINASMGVKAGISVSFPENSARSKGALGLIADPGISHARVEEIFDAHRDEIVAVAHMMHLRIILLPQPPGERKLTERQRQALEWVADGKTAQDVALLMDVSAAMVEKHLKLAREALGVETTAQAVAKAALMNLIFQRPQKLA